MTFAKLVVILMQSRALNENRHVTGALLYSAGQFMQVLEGEEAVVKRLYQTIAHDPRHDNVRTLAEGPLVARRFAQWSMAFGEVPATEFASLQRVAAYQTPAQLASQLAAGGEAQEPLLKKMSELIAACANG